MIVSAVRQIADWLADAATGVNTQLAALPLEAVDSPPPLVTVWDATRFDWVARGVVPRDRTGKLPLLLVHVPSEQELSAWAGDPQGGARSLTVLVDYVRRPQLEPDSDYLVSHAMQTLRACARALQAPFTSVDTRTRTGVDLGRPSFRILAAQEKLAGEETIVATLEVTLLAFDPWVMGATVS